MPVAVVATAGSAAANSFVTAAEATAYLNNRLNASAYWTTGTVDNELRALIEATRELTRLRWEGAPVDDTQALGWPRRYALNPDAANLTALNTGSPYLPALVNLDALYFLTTVIPQRIKDATCELALEFLKAGTTDVAALDATLNVVRKRVDVLETEYAAPVQRAQGLARYPRVMTLIGPLLNSATTGGLSIVRT